MISLWSISLAFASTFAIFCSRSCCAIVLIGFFSATAFTIFSAVSFVFLGVRLSAKAGLSDAFSALGSCCVLVCLSARASVFSGLGFFSVSAIASALLVFDSSSALFCSEDEISAGALFSFCITSAGCTIFSTASAIFLLLSLESASASCCLRSSDICSSEENRGSKRDFEPNMDRI